MKAIPLRRGEAGDAASVAALHADRIGEGFLVTLGPRFLTRLYRRIALSPDALLLVADGRAEDGGSDDGIIGFVAAAASTRRLYGEFLRRDAVAAGLAAAPAILRDPRRVWETFRYGSSDDRDLPAAEILSVAVAAGAAGRGIGGALVAAAQEQLAQLGAPGARVVTAVGNDAALSMYERAGFRRRARTEVHAGVPQEVLVWP
jgi:ribosomal protein S18 acetylase RimI-like enzyme